LDNQLYNTFNNSLTESIQLGFAEGFIILALSVISGIALRFIYKRYATTFSSPDNYGNTILIVTVCVSALIAVVKSSLALSLGLVGALSVIRFRTAVKEPYTLSFILISVCMGIAIGAAQYKFTLVLALAISVCIIFINRRSTFSSLRKIKNHDLDTICLSTSSNESMFNVLSILSSKCDAYNLRSLTDNRELECVATVSIKVPSTKHLEDIVKTISSNPDVLSVNFYNSPN
tara:strand:- start:2 stop:697 length:696 start_codon:yes stop_codon:yes gene_type:complete